MLIWLAQRATRHAHHTLTVRDLKRSWFWRSFASWMRGGDWSAFDLGIELKRCESEEQKHRRSHPRVHVDMAMGAR